MDEQGFMRNPSKLNNNIKNNDNSDNRNPSATSSTAPASPHRRRPHHNHHCRNQLPNKVGNDDTDKHIVKMTLQHRKHSHEHATTNSFFLKRSSPPNNSDNDGHNSHGHGHGHGHDNSHNNTHNNKSRQWRFLLTVLLPSALVLALDAMYLANFYHRRPQTSPQTISWHPQTPSLSRHHDGGLDDDGHDRDRDRDVLRFDLDVLRNVHATYQGARSRIEWKQSPANTPLFVANQNITVAPLMATVDRRPILVRKQLLDDRKTRNVARNGKELGCALSSTTFVSHLKHHDLKKYQQKYGHRHGCEVCFQFSNRKDMTDFLSERQNKAKWMTIETNASTSTKCVKGQATVTSRFGQWQQEEETQGRRFQGFGYPWTVDCLLPNGIPELTCKEISKMQRNIDEGRVDGLLDIRFGTKLVIGWTEGTKRGNYFAVWSQWPWKAVMSHDDDREEIAKKLSMTWNDETSWYVPKSGEELKLAHVEGPGYDQTEYNGKPSIRSIDPQSNSKGGVHVRLLVNLYHYIRNAPGSTHIVAVVDGQAHRSYEYLTEALNTNISLLYRDFWQSLLSEINHANPTDLLPMHEDSSTTSHAFTDMTLMQLLRLRKINILMVPVLTPSPLFEQSVCGGQYQFATYLAARYSADYHVIMFIDGDTSLLERPQTQPLPSSSSSTQLKRTQQQIYYDRFFSPTHSTQCAGHRYQLIEQYVPPSHDTDEHLLQCTHDLLSHPKKWKFAMKNCHLKEGHIVGRTDAIYAYSVHHPDTLKGYAPIGVEDCISPGNTWSERYYLLESEMVQIHLRDRERKKECTCFVNRSK
eukprot:CAMPEP_0171364650 /NCGR_PEP_ID=MMETSP0879-20121228/4157_1 /TAXON_ID=67004 /ORGANISM="Thalassiosira weissflogii, Strain CCMP1336" /LENGTH=808 /DNA_ID=CAMNT_0011872045 /DNA_START=142 /DNA_END=2568 /DNA_ORIENTATION=+